MGKQDYLDNISAVSQLLNKQKKSVYSRHFYEFNRDVLKWPDIYEPLHRKVCDFIVDNVNKKKLLLLLPRGTFKSSIVTVGYSLYRIARNPSDRILIANATRPMATQFLSQIKNHLQRNEEFHKLFGNLSETADSWREDRIYVAREKSYEQKEPTVWAQGIESNVVGSHFDIGILDDVVARENITTKEQIEKVKDFYKDALDLIDADKHGHKKMIVIGCFVAGTKVLMADGTWQNIEEVNAGEMVKTRKGNRVVTANIPQGTSDVYELRTNNGKIVGTKNHPFLRDGKWVEMKDLNKGDKISFYSVKKDGRKDISKELAWALGYMVGDGWVTLHPNQKGSMRYVVGIARGVYEDRNQKIKDIFERNFGCKFKIHRRNWRTTCAELGRWLLENGLERGAHNKKVPNFIFEQDLERRIEFIKGFLDADGWEDKGKYTIKSYSYEVTSKALAEGIRLLAIISGIRVNNIYSRERLIKAPSSKQEVISNTHHCRLYFDKPIKEVFVRSIKKVGRQEVYDLSVDGEHSFIAEGFIVHNTTWHWDDLYQWIQDDLMADFEMMRLPAYEGDWGKGELLFPTRLSWKTLKELRKQQGSAHFCTPGNAPVIMGDLSVKRISEIEKGDEVCGWEDVKPKAKLKRVKVKKVYKYRKKKVVKLKMKSGKAVTCTPEHKWFTGRKDKTHRRYKPAQVGSRLMYIFDPLTKEMTKEQKQLAHWLGGFFDADGSCGSGYNSIALHQSRFANPLIHKKIKYVLEKLGFDYSYWEKIYNEKNPRTRTGFKGMYWINGGKQSKMDFLNWCKPFKKERILSTVYGKSDFIQKRDKVVDIVDAGVRDVYALETETGNYIVYGYGSSNSAQYMLDPIPTEEQIFRPPFRYYEETDLRGIELKKFITCDPAISEEKTADYSALICVGVDKQNTWYILDIWRDRVKPKQLIDQIFYWNEKWKPVNIGIETVAFQKALQYFINDEMKRRNIFIPLKELGHTDRSKDERIRGLQPRFEMGSVFLPQKTSNSFVDDLEDELQRFPKAKNDDLIDALASCLELSFPPKVKEQRTQINRAIYPA